MVVIPLYAEFSGNDWEANVIYNLVKSQTIGLWNWGPVFAPVFAGLLCRGMAELSPSFRLRYPSESWCIFNAISSSATLKAVAFHTHPFHCYHAAEFLHSGPSWPLCHWTSTLERWANMALRMQLSPTLSLQNEMWCHLCTSCLLKTNHIYSWVTDTQTQWGIEHEPLATGISETYHLNCDKEYVIENHIY